MFTDDFTRGSYPEALEVSADWTLVGGTSAINCVTGAQIDNIATASDTLWRCPDQGSADHYSQIDKIDTASSFNFVCVIRATDASNYIGVRYVSGDVRLYKVVAGSFTQLGSSYTHTAVSGDTYKVQAVGDDIEVFLNGTSRVTATDSFNNTETRQGLVSRGSGTTTFDNFEADAVGGGGSSSDAGYYYQANQ